MQNFITKTFLEDDRWRYFANGLSVTLRVTAVALCIGFFGGLLLALVRTAAAEARRPGRRYPLWLRIANGIAGAYITLIRGTPSTLQLLLLFNIVLSGVENPIFVAMIAFGMNSSAYMAEIFRAGVQSVDVGEKEAARSLGLPYGKMMRRIVLPQAFRAVLPALGNEVITLLKETSISGFIGLMDLTRANSIIVSKTFNALPIYMTTATIYLLLVFLLERLFRFLERRTAYAAS
uniref:amino acid ABC transporter permease n=1 Tax=Ndongobacter massiliensis TaxID=1871025 RepID=UPI000930AC50|nr:amino acid ABC transporter permease [Ndongobacter massiliensis]